AVRDRLIRRGPAPPRHRLPLRKRGHLPARGRLHQRPPERHRRRPRHPRPQRQRPARHRTGTPGNHQLSDEDEVISQVIPPVWRPPTVTSPGAVRDTAHGTLDTLLRLPCPTADRGPRRCPQSPLPDASWAREVLLDPNTL